HKVIRVDATTGKREIYSDNSIGLGELFSAKLPNGETAVLQGVVKDDRSNRLIVMEDLANKILTIDLDTRERRLFKDISYIGSNDKDVYANDFDLDHKSELLLITDGLRKAILMVDNVTGEKLILSKSPNNFN